MFRNSVKNALRRGSGRVVAEANGANKFAGVMTRR